MRQGACLRLGVAVLVSLANAAAASAHLVAAASACGFTADLAPRATSVVIQDHVAMLRGAPSAPLVSSLLSRLDAASAEHMTAGEWSDPVDGLRGRLLFAEGEKVGATRIGVVYLELQNLSDVSNPLDIYDGALSGQLVDSSGRQVEQSHGPANVMSPLPFWMALPHDSTLRFRVSVTGYGTPKDGGLSIGLPSGHWLIPPLSGTTYLLSASFTVTPPKDTGHAHPWRGCLNLPTVQVSADHK